MAVLMLNVPLQLSNLANIVFKEHAHLSTGTTGIVLGVVIVLTVISLLTLNEMARVTQKQSQELEKQYWITLG